MALTVNGVTVADGDPLLVGGVQAESVTVNGVEVWKNTQVPTAITDFTCTTTEVAQITCTWSPAAGIPTPTYNLFNIDSGLVVTTGVTSPYVLPHTYGGVNLRVDAVNSAGTTPSNADYGTDKEAAGSEEFTSSGTFTVPNGVTTVTVCMIGGGGGGGDYYADQTIKAGASGVVIENQSISVTPEAAIAVTVGGGGAQNATGGTSSFDSLSAGGGAPNVSSYNGGSRTTCYGSATNGLYGWDGRYMGGQAGFGNGGNGGGCGANGDPGRCEASAGVLGGGGGVRDGRDGNGTNVGGAGVVRVSWA